jgi:hypothetical protein
VGGLGLGVGFGFKIEVGIVIPLVTFTLEGGVGFLTKLGGNDNPSVLNVRLPSLAVMLSISFL